MLMLHKEAAWVHGGVDHFLYTSVYGCTNGMCPLRNIYIISIDLIHNIFLTKCSCV
jgi:hypothetical protein